MKKITELGLEHMRQRKISTTLLGHEIVLQDVVADVAIHGLHVVDVEQHFDSGRVHSFDDIGCPRDVIADLIRPPEKRIGELGVHEKIQRRRHIADCEAERRDRRAQVVGAVVVVALHAEETVARGVAGGEEHAVRAGRAVLGRDGRACCAR